MPVFTVANPGIPSGAARSVLVGVRDLPRYWPLVDSYLLHAKLKPSTAVAHLRAIERLYRFSEQLWPHDSLDAAIARSDLARIDDLLHA